RSNIDKETGIIVANLTQIQQLIMNLCVNAEYAMREKGGILEINLDSVNVDAELASIHTNLKEGPYIKLIVMDTGHGMDKKVAERVFDPFFTTKETGEGTGMGLTIVHGIVSNHGGTIAVNSEPGKGTTFEVYLPKADTIIKNED
ncbi:MAG: ATP-binding protein, partial [Nitrospinota bacterium]|nr:ATP-binding protein [Nitrospinota bacterium]